MVVSAEQFLKNSSGIFVPLNLTEARLVQPLKHASVPVTLALPRSILVSAVQFSKVLLYISALPPSFTLARDVQPLNPLTSNAFGMLTVVNEVQPSKALRTPLGRI